MSVDRTLLPAALYTAEQTRALDRTAIELAGIPGFRLMQRAGRAAFQLIQQYYPQCRSLSILCGTGNNGGDGFVVAALARQHGYEVQLILVGGEDFSDRLRGEALQAWQRMLEQGVDGELFSDETEIGGELIVDAILGTGLGGEVRGVARAAIRQINRTAKPVLALDTPSGICSDSGAVLGEAVEADATLSFIGLKQGLMTYQAVDYTGQLFFDGLLVPDEVFEQVAVSAFRLSAEDLAEILPPRRRTAHKGDFGHLLVVGGDIGMGGAAVMAAEAALRSGAGLVSLATRESHVAASLIRCPEVMVKAVRGAQDLEPLLQKASMVVIGPGLGTDAWGEQLLKAVLASGKSMVLDADALNLIALHEWDLGAAAAYSVVTPHPGEAARLAEQSVTQIQRDRFNSVLALQQRLGAVVLLKGAGTLISDGDATYLCDRGNPGMASGGMGDVLSGIIGALAAQGLSALDAARIGCYLHASAADLAAHELGERGITATDLINRVSRVSNRKV
ncbi:bifunctional ADP-dependent NAD(P)H-hydrate dehydratase/NAD(P)H-hydrate epimerase [Marinobacterium jannaschii]|uniref:bifunctional ADP-dependent NAD(P)H-hydrate dehydratase/NAD(P)H-hydrate epimerase n=1 Tax=Marinobacterium jannaschii TaxID=64970 RepID=UPI00056A4531|nr:bifunctional ADP-dependent NAD(P)H-hydrate dehydratase/NAD(P)H-hydrate epimerase [Marinobacterium jannaschii]